MLSEMGKNLGGPYETQAEAKKRLAQVEFFKHRKAPGKKAPAKAKPTRAKPSAKAKPRGWRK